MPFAHVPACCAPHRAHLLPLFLLAQLTFGRITQLMEMNLEAVLRFIGALGAFTERLRSMSGDFSSLSTLTSSVRRRSIEFGESSLARLRQVQMDRQRVLSASAVLIALLLAFRRRWRGPPRQRQHGR